LRAFASLTFAVALIGCTPNAPAYADTVKEFSQRPEVVCAPFAEILDVLSERTHQTPAIIGQTSEGVGLIIARSPDGPWVMIAVHSNGQGCIIDGGPESLVVPDALANPKSKKSGFKVEPTPQDRKI